MKKFWLDSETLGLNAAEYPLVQLAAIYEGKEFNGYCYWPQTQTKEAIALLVNGWGVSGKRLDDKELLTPQELGDKFFTFLAECRADAGNQPLVLAGHNVKFDLDHLDEFFKRLGVVGIRNVFNYHLFDTAGIAMLMKDLGIIEQYQRIALGELCKLFDVTLEDAHDALCDIRANKQLYDKMQAELRG